MNMVLIKAVPKGGVEEDRKRKYEGGTGKPDDSKGSKGHMGKQGYAKSWGESGWQAPSSGWQAP
eukprot:12709401-Heterocapsa_arctica.AAC.1